MAESRRQVVVTGVGLVTPLGDSPEVIWRAIEAGRSAAAEPKGFEASPYACRVCASVAGFDLHRYLPDNKAERLMNRDALLAAAAARLALRDAGLLPDTTYPAQEIALFGSTGLAGLPLAEVARLVRSSAAPDGSLDLRRFGAVALRQVRPVLSFKILSNMPLCFVSIFENLQGPNGVFNPWEGQGAQAIAAGVAAVGRGDVPCAVAGGCDVKTHELGFIALQRQGVFRSWQETGSGCVPGEGAGFVVLEDERLARRRGAKCYARVAGHAAATVDADGERPSAYESLLTTLTRSGAIDAALPSDDGDQYLAQPQNQAIAACLSGATRMPSPRRVLGNLFAAAAVAQVGLASHLLKRTPTLRRVAVNCFGYGSEQAAFVLEAP